MPPYDSARSPEPAAAGALAAARCFHDAPGGGPRQTLISLRRARARISATCNRRHASSRAARNTTISPAGVPSILAEAEWSEVSLKAKMGLKGYAVLYGPRVSVSYWIVRKPWAALRRILGM